MRTRTIIHCLSIVTMLLLSFPARAESLAGYYLRFVRSEGLLDAIIALIYVICGVMSLYNVVLIYKKMGEGDPQGERNARSWALSLALIAGCTYFLSVLIQDSYTSSQINFGTHIQNTTLQLNSSYLVIRNLVYVCCGIIGLLILPGKFRAIQEGDRYAGKSLTNWGLGLLSVCIGAYIIHLVFFK